MKVPTFAYCLPQDSFYLRSGVAVKTAAFLLLSGIALVSSDPLVLLLLALLVILLIISTGYARHHRLPFFFTFFATAVFSLSWLLLSRVPGDVMYSLPWGTWVSDGTLTLMAVAIGKWYLIAFSGFLYLIVVTESEIIQGLLRLRLPRRAVYAITIALNTAGFAMRDIETIQEALHARGYPRSGVINRLRGFAHVGAVLLLVHLKRTETLTQAYALRGEE